MSKLQSAYHKFHSSETALLYVQGDIIASLDVDYSTSLLLGMSAAFNITKGSRQIKKKEFILLITVS